MMKHFWSSITSCVLFISALASNPEKWSPEEDSATFLPSHASVLEQWANINTPVGTEDITLRTVANERDDKVMKRPPNNTDRIVNNPPSKEVSETDLFLLGAIEKLAYRLDFLEKRAKRMEEMIYKLVAGNSETSGEPCPEGFNRHNSICYHFSTKLLNWKSASSLCRGMGGILMEMHSNTDLRKFEAFIQGNRELQGNDYWTGGLNPGLLWLWGASAKPVINNNNQTEVAGNGRCLLLGFNPPTRTYQYKGSDCSARHRYICQIEDNTTERRLQKLLSENK